MMVMMLMMMVVPIVFIFFALFGITLPCALSFQGGMMDIEVEQVVAYFLFDLALICRADSISYYEVGSESGDGSADRPDVYVVYVLHTVYFYDRFFDLFGVYILRYAIE